MRDSVKFVHTADLHLDAPFQGIGRASERVGQALAEATYEAFRRVVDTAVERAVDFVVIAGDSYNARDKSLRAQRRFLQEMVRLSEAAIEVFVVQGNHDPATGWSARLKLPENVHVFSPDTVERFEVVRDADAVAAVYGRSFARAAETSNLALEYHRRPGDPIAVGVLHANVGGIAGYDPYAPATLEELRAAGMDYWALGHIHKQEVLSRDPWVAYAGSPQGLNPKEIGAHGCLVVEVGPGGGVTAEHVETAPIAWARAEIDLSAADGLEGVRDLIAEACEQLLEREGRHVIARVTLGGRSGVHGDLARPNAVPDLLEDVRAEFGAGDPWLWLDRLEDRSGALLDLDALRGGADFAAEIVRVTDETARDPDLTDSLIAEIFAPVSATLPGDYRPGISSADALASARDLVLDRLVGGEIR